MRSFGRGGGQPSLHLERVCVIRVQFLFVLCGLCVLCGESSGFLREEGGATFVPDAAIRNSSAIKAVTFRPVHVTPAVIAASSVDAGAPVVGHTAVFAAPAFGDVLSVGKTTAFKADSPSAVVSYVVGYK